MSEKITKLFASASAPEVYSNAFQAACTQIQSGLGSTVTLSNELRARAQELNDLADLVDVVMGAEMDKPEKPDMKKPDEKEDKKEDKKEDPKEEPKV